jgi:CheY-like chemotaxis protein/anti-sigma regulatory factor (Ser/Thr protein kinase)
MALFAILFGTQSLSASDKHPGLMLTIAFASVVKLMALLIVGIYVCYVMFDGVLDLFGQAQLHPRSQQIIQFDSAIVAKRKGLALRYVPSSCFIQSDKKLLRRILQNLISNALRYTDSGKILIGAKKQNQQLKIRVYDTGKGIAPDQQKAIFEEFNQLNQHNNNQGLGLGLTIVERISALLHHTIEVKSAVNQGSCFEITVSKGVAVHGSSSIPSYSTVDSAVLLTDNVVVIIENDENTIEAVSHLLRSWGATVYAFNTIEDALSHCPTCPDLLFLDYHLDNGATGTQAAALLRRKWQVNIPAILSSADRTEEVRKKAIDAQLHYLPKPIKPAALKRFIKQVIHLPKVHY